MSFQLTKEHFTKLRDAIQAGNDAFINAFLEELHASDIAEIFNELNLEEAKFIYKHLSDEEAGKVLVEMDEDIRERFLASLTSKEIAEQFIDNMESDDAADVIAELPDKVQGEVLAHIEDSEQASDIVDLLNYDKNTAGGLMAKELVEVNVAGTMLDCVRSLREHADDIKHIYAIYVVDDTEKLVGLISLKKVLTTPLRTPIRDVFNTEIISVKVNTDAAEAARIMEKYDLVVLPVTDLIGRLAGRITIDDVVDVIRQEETEDVQKMAAVEVLDEPYMTIPLWPLIKKRVGWLIILFVGESFTATAMSFFEGQIEKAVVLALFVPLIISSGGNTGSQASTLIIRALALGEVTIREWWRIVKKEIVVGFSLGLILGAIGFIRIALWSAIFKNVYGDHWLMVAVTVSVSLVGVVLWGNLSGSVLPIVLKKFGRDPAVSSAPFVATLVDVTGLVIYFSVATLMLRGILL
ncbi:MAG: magnesium transporter [Bacteroidia bacterium]